MKELTAKAAREAARVLVWRTKQASRRKFPGEAIQILLEGIRAEISAAERYRRDPPHRLLRVSEGLHGGGQGAHSARCSPECHDALREGRHRLARVVPSSRLGGQDGHRLRSEVALYFLGLIGGTCERPDLNWRRRRVTCCSMSGNRPWRSIAFSNVASASASLPHLTVNVGRGGEVALIALGAPSDGSSSI